MPEAGRSTSAERAKGRTRKARYRATEIVKNADNDLKCRIRRSAKKKFGGVIDSLEAMEWIEAEYAKRKAKLQSKWEEREAARLAPGTSHGQEAARVNSSSPVGSSAPALPASFLANSEKEDAEVVEAAKILVAMSKGKRIDSPITQTMTA